MGGTRAMGRQRNPRSINLHSLISVVMSWSVVACGVGCALLCLVAGVLFLQLFDCLKVVAIVCYILALVITKLTIRCSW